MNQPSPWILLIGGGALLNVGLMIGGAKAPAWARYTGLGLCMALGLTCIALALGRYFQKKPERQRYQPKRGKEVDLSPEVAKKLGGRKSRKDAPPPPPDAA